ncbi:MAG: hypothetical protein JRF60_16630, partial [Deltaproteobacteria bacterium]|nr:hypothetical protein [Deltaproteobacteria bacterium]
AATLLEENTKLKKEKKEIDSSLKKADKSVEELNKSYSTLKTESADYIKLKSKFKKTASQLAEYTEKSELL